MARNFSPSAANCGQQRPDIVINGLGNIVSPPTHRISALFSYCNRKKNYYLLLQIAMTAVHITVIFDIICPIAAPATTMDITSSCCRHQLCVTSAARPKPLLSPHQAETFYSLKLLHNTGHRRTQLQE